MSIRILAVTLLILPISPEARETAPYELNPLTVVSTATRTPRLATEVPIRTELLSAELFALAGTRDLASAIEYLPGARVESNCQNCGTSEVKLLGLGAGYNQLLFDSQPLFSGLASVYGLEHIPTAFIERIEVVKGGASSVYGPGAVAGVINIIPHEPVVTIIDFEADYEVFDGEPARTAVGVFDWVDAQHRCAATLYGETKTNEAVDLNGDGFSEITEKDFRTIGTNAWAYPTDGLRISANYAYTWEQRRGGDRFELLPHEAQITEQLEHHWHRGGIFLEHSVSPDFSYKIGGSLSNIERLSYYGGVGAVALPGAPDHDPAAYASAVEDAKLFYGYTSTERLYFDSIFTYHAGHHVVSAGAQFQRDRVFDEKRDEANRSLRTDGSLAARRGEDPIADAAFENLGFFFQDEWDPTTRWTVISGLRLDQHTTLDRWVLSPRFAIRRTLSSAWILRASVATGFRAPEIFDEDLHIEILDDPTRTRNAPTLKEETSISYTVGLVWTPEPFEGRMQLEMELFRTEISDTFNVPDVIFHDSAGSAYKERENAGGSTVQGFEANVLFQVNEHLRLEGGINFTEAAFEEPQAVLPGVFTRRYLESPRWSGVAQINYELTEQIELFAGLVYTGPMIAAREAEGTLNRNTGHFFVIDLTLTRHFQLGTSKAAPHLDLTLGVRNLLDQRQDDLTLGPERDTTYLYGPRFPRSFLVSARIHF
jgi:outer membrane receptor for ferrienterochelin and colicins